MVTMLEECITEEQHSVLHFLWAKEHNAKDIDKEILRITEFFGLLSFVQYSKN
jgi:hypothetical protein